MLPGLYIFVSIGTHCIKMKKGTKHDSFFKEIASLHPGDRSRSTSQNHFSYNCFTRVMQHHWTLGFRILLKDTLTPWEGRSVWLQLGVSGNAGIPRWKLNWSMFSSGRTLMMPSEVICQLITDQLTIKADTQIHANEPFSCMVLHLYYLTRGQDNMQL